MHGLNAHRIKFGQLLKGYNVRANQVGHPPIKVVELRFCYLRLEVVIKLSREADAN